MERTKQTGDEVQKLVDDLADTLQRTLAESPQVTHCLNRIRADGYDVSVSLEATIGFSRASTRERAAGAAFDFRLEQTEPAPLKMTPLDKKFLRSLKISVEEEED